MGILIIPLHLPGDGPGLRRQQAQGPTNSHQLASVSHGLACGFPAAGLWPLWFPCSWLEAGLWPLCGDTATHNPAQGPPMPTLASW